jgi:hypothetical protein
MARRRKDDATEHRTKRLTVQLTPTERGELDARADKYGQSLSDFARLLLLSERQDPLPAPRDSRAIRALTVELVRVGTNLNQLAHIANERRQLPREREFQTLWEQIDTAIQKVAAL